MSLNLDVIFNAQADVTGILVDVGFTPQGSTTATTLYHQDMPATTPKTYSPGDEFKDSVSWLIPTFAPVGHYSAKITVHGKDAEKTKHVCLTADFNISA